MVTLISIYQSQLFRPIKLNVSVFHSQTRLERPMAVRQQRTVRYISHGPDIYLRPHQCPPTNAPHLDDLALTPYHLQEPPEGATASLH